MKTRNLKVRKVLKALKDYGCLEVRNTSHGVIVENPKNGRSTNVPVHQEILPVWIYKNILRQLGINNKEELEKYF
ncbi:MAG: type II toxin-antitoxin system HicA family toxin [Bacteroidetes bacterium]|nr:type II toxin-antitoxin system HicA family toxin [Bacteroidota bacterium]